MYNLCIHCIKTVRPFESISCAAASAVPLQESSFNAGITIGTIRRGIQNFRNSPPQSLLLPSDSLLPDLRSTESASHQSPNTLAFFPARWQAFFAPSRGSPPTSDTQFALGCGEGRTAFDSPAAQPLPSSWTRDSLRPGWPSSSHQTLPVPPGKPAFSICTLLFFTRCLSVAHSLTCLLQESVLQRAVAILFLAGFLRH